MVADEAARIEREFEGALNLTVLRDPAFQVASESLGVRLHSYRAGDLSNTVNWFSFILCRFVGIKAVGMESSSEPFSWLVLWRWIIQSCVLLVGSLGL